MLHCTAAIPIYSRQRGAAARIHAMSPTSAATAPLAGGRGSHSKTRYASLSSKQTDNVKRNTLYLKP